MNHCLQPLHKVICTGPDPFFQTYIQAYLIYYFSRVISLISEAIKNFRRYVFHTAEMETVGHSIAGARTPLWAPLPTAHRPPSLLWAVMLGTVIHFRNNLCHLMASHFSYSALRETLPNLVLLGSHLQHMLTNALLGLIAPP